METKSSDFKKGEIAIYSTKDGKTRLEVSLSKDTVWLSQQQIAQLFVTERSVITKHIKNIFSSRELHEKSNVQKMHIPHSDKSGLEIGDSPQHRDCPHPGYNRSLNRGLSRKFATCDLRLEHWDTGH